MQVDTFTANHQFWAPPLLAVPQCCMYNEHPPHQVKGTPTAASCVSDPCGIVFACATALGRPAGHKVLSAAVLLIGDGLDRLHLHPLLSHGSHRRPLPTRTFRKYGQLTRSWGAAGCGKPTVSSFGCLHSPTRAGPDGVGWGVTRGRRSDMLQW